MRVLLSVFGSFEGSTSSRSTLSVGEVHVQARFDGPGSDTFQCVFPALTEDGLRVDVLWNVDGAWISEAVIQGNQQGQEFLPQDRTTLKDGSTVGIEWF